MAESKLAEGPTGLVMPLLVRGGTLDARGVPMRGADGALLSGASASAAGSGAATSVSPTVGTGSDRTDDSSSIGLPSWGDDARVLGSSAVELAAAIRNGHTTSEAVVAAVLRRLEAVKVLNGVAEMREAALDDARAADAALAAAIAAAPSDVDAVATDTAGVAPVPGIGPLHGVPVTIKERFAVRGMKVTGGSLVYADDPPQAEDAVTVARLRAAGAVIICTTNEAEFGFAFETDNLVYGRTLNPWRLDRTCGGSSGGEAALVAAGASALGLGSDMGGSIRVPAHFCGCCGMKPTVGLVPLSTGGPLDPARGGLSNRVRCWGPIARCVADLELALSLLSGPDYVDPIAVAPAYELGAAAKVDVSSLRVGFYVSDGVTAVTADTEATIRRAAAELREACVVASVVEMDPLPGMRGSFRTFERLCNRQGSDKLSKLVTEPSEPLRMLFADGPNPGASSVEDYDELVVEWDAYRSLMLRTLAEAGADVLLCPVAPSGAVEHGEGKIAQRFNYSAAYNLAGWPAVVVGGVGLGSEGTIDERLPIGVQVVAPPHQDARALRVATLVERYVTAEAFCGEK